MTTKDGREVFKVRSNMIEHITCGGCGKVNEGRR